jgi:Tfp pilus assembly protein PilV
MMSSFQKPRLPRRPFFRAGFSLIEIVAGIAMLTIFLVSINAYYRKVLEVSQDTTRHIQSSFLLEEGLEVLRSLRDQSWTTHIASLTPGGTYYLYWDGSAWSATTTEQVVERWFTRSFVLEEVLRDGSDNIAAAGVLDPGTRKVVVSVTWVRKSGAASSTDVAETYMTDLFSN